MFIVINVSNLVNVTYVMSLNQTSDLSKILWKYSQNFLFYYYHISEYYFGYYELLNLCSTCKVKTIKRWLYNTGRTFRRLLLENIIKHLLLLLERIIEHWSTFTSIHIIKPSGLQATPGWRIILTITHSLNVPINT